MKEISITYSGGVSVALVVQHARCMRRIILSSVGSLDLISFSTTHKRREIRKKFIEDKMCVFIFDTTLKHF